MLRRVVWLAWAVVLVVGCGRKEALTPLLPVETPTAAIGSHSYDPSLAGCDPAVDPPTVQEPPPALVVNPSRLFEVFGAHDSTSIEVEAIARIPIDDSAYVIIVDGGGVMASDISISKSGDGVYWGRFQTSSELEVGCYRGVITVQICKDRACGSKYAEEPLLIPYVFRVMPSQNLTPLSRLAGAGDWGAYQGNASHSGHLPVTLDETKFSPRWIWQAPDADASLNALGIATAGDTVYVSASTFSALSLEPNWLYALSESDHGLLWKQEFEPGAVSPPALEDQRLFLTSSSFEVGTQSQLTLSSYDRETGTRLFGTSFDVQGPGDHAIPTLYGGAVYYSGGYFGGLNSVGAMDGAKHWFLDIPFRSSSTPAADNTYLYVFTPSAYSVPSKLAVIDRLKGTESFTIDNPGSEGSYAEISGAPMISSADRVVCFTGRPVRYEEQSKVISFSIPNREIAWSTSGQYLDSLAVANGVVYAGNNSPYRLEARRESDGELLWHWTPEGRNDYGFGNIIVTDNMLLVSTSKRTYAVSLTAHVPVWSFWQGGHLALSANGILYISSYQRSGRLYAVNLN